MPITHTVTCHCGAVEVAATLDLTQPTDHCNCSICLRTGYVGCIEGLADEDLALGHRAGGWLARPVAAGPGAQRVSLRAC